jgi:hypothetical protein
MQYNPGVYDRSGEIIAAGTMQAAQTQADLMRELGEKARQTATAVAGFAAGGPAGAAMASGGGRSGGGGGGGGGGSILESIVGAYAQKEQDKSDSKIYGNLMKIVAPAFGKDGDSMLEQWNSLENDREKARFGSTLFSSLGQISNMYMAQGRMEQAPALQAQRVTDQREIMYEREQLARERQAMSTPPAPAAITVPPAMRRFGNPNNP